jgi:hypothetical protein
MHWRNGRGKREEKCKKKVGERGERGGGLGSIIVT